MRTSLLLHFFSLAVFASALRPKGGIDETGLGKRLERLERGEYEDMLPLIECHGERRSPCVFPAAPSLSLFPCSHTPCCEPCPFLSAACEECARTCTGALTSIYLPISTISVVLPISCSAQALGTLMHKSELWTIPGMTALAALVRDNSTSFVAAVPCVEASAAAFHEALSASTATTPPRIAVVLGGSPPRRGPGRPWLTMTPRAALALASVQQLLQLPMAALEARGNLSLALEIDVDVDETWFVSGRPSAQVKVIHLVGQGRIIVNSLVAAQLNARAASGKKLSLSQNLSLLPVQSLPPPLPRSLPPNETCGMCALHTMALTVIFFFTSPPQHLQAVPY